jgi:hypothetical protein
MDEESTDGMYSDVNYQLINEEPTKGILFRQLIIKESTGRMVIPP